MKKKMRSYFAIASILCLYSVSLYAQPKDSRICGKSVLNGVSLQWCVNQTDRLKNPDIVHFFHGMAGSEKTWDRNSDHDDIRNEWQRLGYTAPTVITVSFGRKWLLHDVIGSPQLLTGYLDKLLPELEDRVGGLGHGKRMAMGRSMGGFNALQVFTKRMDLFAKAVLLCPAIASVGPFSSETDISNYIQSTGADAGKVQRMLAWIREVFPSPAEWSSHNPIQLAETKFHSGGPKVFVSCGQEDEYGFHQSARAIAEMARDKGMAGQWEPVDGGHCSFDAVKVAQFLSH